MVDLKSYGLKMLYTECYVMLLKIQTNKNNTCYAIIICSEILKNVCRAKCQIMDIGTIWIIAVFEESTDINLS